MDEVGSSIFIENLFPFLGRMKIKDLNILSWGKK